MEKIRILLILMLVLLFGAAQLNSESKSENFNLVCDVLDGSSGSSQSSNFMVKVSSAGLPSPIGEVASSNFKVRGGYVYSASVLHGDTNADGVIELGDIIYLINYVFREGPEPVPLEAGDVNCDLIIELGDIVYLQNYLYRDGPPPCDPPLETVTVTTKE